MVFKSRLVTNLNFYLSVYRYVCKSDEEVAHSEIHPPGLLTAASRKTKMSIAGFRAACVTKRKSTEGEPTFLWCYKEAKKFGEPGFSRVHLRKGYQKLHCALTIAEEQRTASLMDIAELVFKRNKKILRELVTKTWQMESAKEKLKSSKVSRINTVKTHLNSDCVEGCSGQRLPCAKEVLLLNGIDTFQFVTSIKDLLIHDRGKNRNLIITAPANCAKHLC